MARGSLTRPTSGLTVPWPGIRADIRHLYVLNRGDCGEHRHDRVEPPSPTDQRLQDDPSGITPHDELAQRAVHLGERQDFLIRLSFDIVIEVNAHPQRLRRGPVSQQQQIFDGKCLSAQG
jgi:hypothetical protein